MSGDEPIVITLAQRKGGTGKTTSVWGLAGALAADGKKVLLLDLDPQGSLTTALLGPSAAEAVPPARTTAALFGDAMVAPASLIHKTALPNVSLVPSHEALALSNLPITPGTDEQLLRGVVDFVAAAAGFDCLLIDTPPNVGTLSFAAVAAATLTLSPLPLDLFALTEVKAVAKLVEAVRRRVNPSAGWAVFANMVSARAALQKTILEQVRATYKGLILRSEIPAAAAYPESVVAGRPLPLSKPRAKESKAIVALALEALQRAIVTDNPADGRAAA